MASPVCFKYDFSKHFDKILQTHSAPDSTSNSLKLVTQDVDVTYIPKSFIFFCPLLADILRSTSYDGEIVIILPDYASKDIKRLYELVSQGYIVGNLLDSEINEELSKEQIIKEVVEAGSQFNIKITQNNFSSEKETVDNKTVLSEYCELHDGSVSDFKDKEYKTPVNYEADWQNINLNIKFELQEDEHSVNEKQVVVDENLMGSSVEAEILGVNEGHSMSSNICKPLVFNNNKGDSIEVSDDIEHGSAPKQDDLAFEDPHSDSVKAIKSKKQSIKSHIQEVYKGVRFYCQSCDYMTKRSCLLKLHIQVHHEGLRYSCDICSYQCKYKHHLKYHLRSTHEGVRFPCCNCEYKAKSQQQLKQHIQEKHENIRFSCTDCDYITKRRAYLKLHVQVHHEGVKHSCNICGFQSKYKHLLKRHIQIVHEGVVFNCPKCEFSAKRQEKLKRHIRVIHECVRYDCPSCQYKARNKSSLKNHLKVIHGSKSKDMCYTTH